MTSALGSGAVDLVGLARPLAVEPDLPAKLLGDPTASARPIALATGVRDLDALVQGSWYGTQLSRMGRGRSPDPGLWRITAAFGYLSRHLRHRLRGSPRALPAPAPASAVA